LAQAPRSDEGPPCCLRLAPPGVELGAGCPPRRACLRSGDRAGWRSCAKFSTVAMSAELVALLCREEALLLCTCLSPEDVAQLTCVASWQERKGLWRAYFMLRWGAEISAGPGTQVRILRSWIEDSLPSPWPLAVGFCGALSAMDHLFWFLPFIRCSLHLATPRHIPALTPPSLAWQVACRARALPGGAARLGRCFLCDEIEVAPPGPALQHFRQRWTRPCANCARFAHRACLERWLMDSGTGGGAVWGLLAPSSSSSASSPSARLSNLKTKLAGASEGAIPSLTCETCGRQYRITRRFPETFQELLRATAEEWRWTLRRIFTCIMFFVWIRSLAGHYCSMGGVSKEIYVLLAFSSAMMSISVSSRFHRGIQMIWDTPYRWRYFQLFGLFVLLFYLVSLRVLDPSLWAAAATHQPWMAALHEVHSMIHESFLGTLLLSTISLLYLIAASGVIFLFWKTSLRVPTIGDDNIHAENIMFQSGANTQCGLCQLGLCLDNTCM